MRARPSACARRSEFLGLASQATATSAAFAETAYIHTLPSSPTSALGQLRARSVDKAAGLGCLAPQFYPEAA